MSLNGSEMAGQGITAYTRTDWEDYGECNVDFDETKRTKHVQLRLTPREHYLLCHLAVTRVPKVGLNDAIMALLNGSGVFNNQVDFYGHVNYENKIKSNKDINFKKKAKPKDKIGQAKLF